MPKELTVNQSSLIDKLIESKPKVLALAKAATDSNMNILARELFYIHDRIGLAITMQLRSFRDGSLSDATPLIIGGLSAKEAPAQEESQQDAEVTTQESTPSPDSQGESETQTKKKARKKDKPESDSAKSASA